MPAYRIVFHNPPNPDSYYHSDESLKLDGIFQTRPLTTPNVSESHTFSNRDSVISFRDQYRTFYPKIKIFIEDAQHNGPLFEYDREPADTGAPDTRNRLWVSPDELESQGLGFLVRPCVLPGQGKVYGMAPLDVPSLSEHLGAVDTIYSRPGESPVDFVERARRAWMALGLPVIGIPWPNEAKQVTAETKQLLQEANSPGRLRRPDLR